ncbi:cell division protein FtsQ/DivIB [Pelomonas sp. SE-A7]|uniref:cell division protein FtsQ/DivIB n=1 Tax=Pelomonas sp. SE-A7 TaxID=3054953 RepID=UPI00259D004A|nr:cell division protein FtsQ/DivIB [Pelomonas sp. SE-A7]MDM4766294.1 cell division protein FtsQ/DivIB [Pelomonas sp. SE-A7]
MAANTALDQALPPDVRLMNGVAVLLMLGLVLAVLAYGANWLARRPVFAIRAVQIEGDVARNSSATLRANALPRLSGTFLTMNLQQARQAFEAVPWVRQATVQRIWPARLKVTLEEHRPAAYWELKAEGADAQSDAAVERQLVNSFGEVFQANLGDVEDENLPTLSGPTGSAGHMLMLWKQLQPLTEALSDSAERLDLSGRGSWRLKLEKGAEIELGRGSDAEVLARYEQFVRTLTQMTSRYQAPLLAADLRHRDGYALKLRGVTTSGPEAGAKNKSTKTTRN